MSAPVVADPPRRPRAKRTCQHCGAPLLDARMEETGFCCAGCAYVFRLVHEHGLAGYYRLKDDEGTRPTVQTVVTEVGENAALFEIYSCTEDNLSMGNEWKLHASGKLNLNRKDE